MGAGFGIRQSRYCAIPADLVDEFPVWRHCVGSGLVCAAPAGANACFDLGLAGVGDLYVTSVSPLSRNFRIGRALAGGVSLDVAEAELGQVAEGINTLRLVYERCHKDGIAMPILSALYDVIFGGKPVRQTALQMMQAAHTSDVEFLMPGASQSL